MNWRESWKKFYNFIRKDVKKKVQTILEPFDEFADIPFILYRKACILFSFPFFL